MSTESRNLVDDTFDLAASGGHTDDSDVVSALCRTANHVRQHLEHSVLHPADMNWTTYDVLHLVVAHRVIDTRTVAKTSGIAKSTVTLTVRALTERDLVRRSIQQGDQRHVWLRPTTTGWQVLHELRPKIADEQQRLLDGRVPGFGTHALPVLRQLAAMHTTMTAPAADPTDFPE